MKEKGIIIVSAFDNSGIISYPAALASVIGIDVKNNMFEYEFVKNTVGFVLNGSLCNAVFLSILNEG